MQSFHYSRCIHHRKYCRGHSHYIQSIQSDLCRMNVKLSPSAFLASFIPALIVICSGCVFDPTGLSESTNDNVNINANANTNTNTNTDSVCGNNVTEPGEFCDGSDLNGRSCASEGFTGGTLGCLSDCSGFDTTGCQDPAVWCENHLLLHLDAASITGLNHGDSIALWEDLSENDNHGEQNIPSQQPIYLEHEQNSLPVVEFNGHTLRTPAVPIDGGQLSVFAVTRSNHTADSKGTILRQGATGWEGDPHHPFNSFGKRLRLITNPTMIDDVLLHFPLTVFLNADNGDTNRVFDEVGPNRLKIAIADDSPTPVQYYVEVEQWEEIDTMGILHFGRAGQTIPADSPKVYFLYHDGAHADNTAFVGETGSVPAQNVWDNNFLGRWDGKDATNSSLLDSTSNANHGAKKTADEPTETAGKIGPAQFYDGADDYVELPFLLDPSFTEFTLSTWFNAVGSDTHVLVSQKDGTGTGRSWMYVNDDQSLSSFFAGSQRPSGHTVTSGAWVHAVITWSNSTLQWYVNGIAMNNNSFTMEPATGGHVFGAQKLLDNQPFAGIIDETRISHVARPAAWIRATYHTANDDLLSYETEDPQPYPNFSYNYRGSYLEASVSPDGSSDTVSGAATGFVVGCFVSNQTDKTLSIDGMLVDSHIHITVPDVENAPLNIGDLSLNGNIAELIVCSRPLTLDEQKEIVDYLGIKWLGW